jgi:hypothetical protein
MSKEHFSKLVYSCATATAVEYGVQNLLNMVKVFLPSLVVNENVIQIHHYKSISEWS